MKKICIFAIMMLSICFTHNSYAEYNVMWEPIKEWKPLIYENGKAPVIVEINGQKYFWNSLQVGNHVIKYNEHNDKLYDFLANKTDCIWTGEYYMTRNSEYDREGIKFKPYIKNPIKFYDKDFNLVHEQTFGNTSAYGYPEAIAYDMGKYYCRIYDGETKTLSSEDMVNWSEDNEYRWKTVVGNTVYRSDPSEISVSGSKFYGRLLEDVRGRLYNNMINLGEYECIIDDKGIHLTADRVYWLDISISNLPNDITFSKYSSYAYEYGENIVIQTSLYRFTTPKQEIYDALESLQKTPYVVYNEDLLVFEVPPVIQDDHTLIPARFLFEQMGAEVGWNQDTQTATITQDNTAISLAIDDNIATVNGEPVTMDVPARLINGKTMVPVRFLSEELGYNVEWDGENRIITIE